MRALMCSVVIAACEPAGPAPAPRPQPSPAPAALAAPHELVATLERAGRECEGQCASYTLAIYRDGVVEYDGQHFVMHPGAATARISAAELAALDRLFADARYFDLDSDYTRQCVTDMPTVTTTYWQHNRFKRIVHYLGTCREQRQLTDLEEGIDRMVDVERWIGTPQHRENATW
jgi:hypothetical protein